MQQCPFMGPPDAAAAKPRPGLRYSSYLQLDSLLDSQSPLSGTHDEMLFIIQHQTAELWMKLLLHELTRACKQLRASQLPQASKTVARAQRTMDHLVHSWNVLATLTPVEFLRCAPRSVPRPAISRSSSARSSSCSVTDMHDPAGPAEPAPARRGRACRRARAPRRGRRGRRLQRARLVLTNGQRAAFDLLIGADGADSRVRTALSRTVDLGIDCERQPHAGFPRHAVRLALRERGDPRAGDFRVLGRLHTRYADSPDGLALNDNRHATLEKTGHRRAEE